jgi:hypothetical protein
VRFIIATASVLLAAGTANAQGDVQARMRLWSTALGVQCLHCHVESSWSDSSKPVFQFAQRMMRMVNGINTGPLNGIEPITCWTCHRGQARPARVTRASWEAIQKSHDSDFASKPDRALAMSVYSASLGVECSHCHEAGNWPAATKPAHAMVEKMTPIFDEIPKHFDDTRRPTTQCYMCHQGQRIPERQPR